MESFVSVFTRRSSAWRFLGLTIKRECLCAEENAVWREDSMRARLQIKAECNASGVLDLTDRNIFARILWKCLFDLL